MNSRYFSTLTVLKPCEAISSADILLDKENVLINKDKMCRSGETGRRSGLKIHRASRPCRFDSGLRHQYTEEKQDAESCYFNAFIVA
jgi:hypothetical protein